MFRKRDSHDDMRVAEDVVEENGIVSSDSKNDKHSDENSQTQSNQTYTNGTHFTGQ